MLWTGTKQAPESKNFHGKCTQLMLKYKVKYETIFYYYLQIWFLAQHSVAMFDKCCNYSKQSRNNVATLHCAKNCHCKLSFVQCSITLTLRFAREWEKMTSTIVAWRVQDLHDFVQCIKTDLNAVLSQLIIILHFGVLHYHGHDPFKMFSNPMTCLSAV